ncbi:hypothetical protein LC593_07670 [Nostoc sp. CHAB 5844]|nr:hypothetical protein [Nostoc sp. CHAB 5844]
MLESDMRQFLEKFPIYGEATFFLWKSFENINWGKHELEPHPYISETRKWSDEVETLVNSLQINPQGMRSHSCFYSHTFGVYLKKHNYLYTTMTTPLLQDNLYPYRQPWGIWELPIYYMDNMDFCMPLNWLKINYIPFDANIISKAIKGKSLYVFDFHPLHIILNTRTYNDYSLVRDEIVKEGKSPFNYSFEGRGTRTFFEELCQAMLNFKNPSLTCLDALKQFEYQLSR